MNLMKCDIIFYVYIITIWNFGSGYLGPGGRHMNGQYLNCTGGTAGYVDKLLLRPEHIYQYPLADSVYGSGPFDPEGILGLPLN